MEKKEVKLVNATMYDVSMTITEYSVTLKQSKNDGTCSYISLDVDAAKLMTSRLVVELDNKIVERLSAEVLELRSQLQSIAKTFQFIQQIPIED